MYALVSPPTAKPPEIVPYEHGLGWSHNAGVHPVPPPESTLAAGYCGTGHRLWHRTDTVATDMGIRQNWAPDGLHRYKDCNSLYSHKHCTGLCSSPCLPPSPYWPDNKSARTVQLLLSRKERKVSQPANAAGCMLCPTPQATHQPHLTGRWASSHSSRILPTKASELKSSSPTTVPQLGSNRSPRDTRHRS